MKKTDPAAEGVGGQRHMTRLPPHPDDWRPCITLDPPGEIRVIVVDGQETYTRNWRQLPDLRMVADGQRVRDTVNLFDALVEDINPPHHRGAADTKTPPPCVSVDGERRGSLGGKVQSPDGLSADDAPP